MKQREERPEETLLICGVPAGTIARAIAARAGNLERNRQALRGVAQAMLDMEESGEFGAGLDAVLDAHFRHRSEIATEACLDAVKEVFLDGMRRERGWKILQALPRKAGEPLFREGGRKAARFPYLGKDELPSGEAILYFGRKPFYRVFVQNCRLRATAERTIDYLHQCGWSAQVQKKGEEISVFAGSFSERSKAVLLAEALQKSGFRSAKVTEEF